MMESKQIIRTVKTDAYGIWEAVVRLPDGQVVRGHGFSAAHAAYNAGRRVACEGGTRRLPCTHTLSAEEEPLSRLVYGRALCACCRDARRGPSPFSITRNPHARSESCL